MVKFVKGTVDVPTLVRRQLEPLEGREREREGHYRRMETMSEVVIETIEKKTSECWCHYRRK